MPLSSPVLPHSVDLDKLIANGRLVSTAQYATHIAQVFGPTRTVLIGSGNPSPATQVVQVGNQPDGYGKTIIWDRTSDAILCAIFLNAADAMGVSISNVSATDYVTISSVDGIASFSKDKGNPIASSIVGIISDGLKAVLTATGSGSIATPLLSAGTNYAQTQFAATNNPTALRDGFGIQPKDHSIERQEGGICIALPQADGPIYSGEDQKWWIKPGQSRDDAHRPPQAAHGFFPQPNVLRVQNGRQAGANGEVYITPWDYSFADNAGWYKVFVVVSKAQLH